MKKFQRDLCKHLGNIGSLITRSIIDIDNLSDLHSLLSDLK